MTDKVDLANLDNSRRWKDMLDKAAEAYPTNFFNEYESNFVKKMMQHDADDRPIWNPTLRQWNYLHTLVAGL